MDTIVELMPAVAQQAQNGGFSFSIDDLAKLGNLITTVGFPIFLIILFAVGIWRIGRALAPKAADAMEAHRTLVGKLTQFVDARSYRDAKVDEAIIGTNAVISRLAETISNHTDQQKKDLQEMQKSITAMSDRLPGVCKVTGQH